MVRMCIIKLLIMLISICEAANIMLSLEESAQPQVGPVICAFASHSSVCKLHLAIQRWLLAANRRRLALKRQVLVGNHRRMAGNCRQLISGRRRGRFFVERNPFLRKAAHEPRPSPDSS